MNETEGEYKIGRGKPPLHTRFKKGQSGNPRGPRRKNLPALLVAALNAPVVVTTGGKSRRITKREAVVAQLVDKSAGADLRATKMLLDILQDIEKRASRASPPEPSPLTPADEEVVENLLARLRRTELAKIHHGDTENEPLSTLQGGEGIMATGEQSMTPVETLNLEEYRALRRDFVSFAQRCFRELNPKTRFAMGWHIELIAAKLMAVRDGRIRRLVINLPPRHLKSLLASVAFPAWCLGHDPSAQILCVSYAQDLADKLSRDCRHIVASGWYRQIFLGTRLSPQRAAMPEFDTTAQGCRLATSVGGVLTGRGADLIIIDDPLKPEEALSQTQRQAANDWYDHTLYSRLNDKLEGAIVLIMHRLHEDDLTAHALAQDAWEVVRLPAFAEADEELRVDTALGPQCFSRRRGEALQPERGPLAVLDHIRRTIGEYNFAGQYQQAPAPLGGGLVKAVWFPRYRPDELPQRFERIVQSWDTANKASELSDFSVCTSWGVAGKNLYLIDVLRRRMEYPELKRAVHEQYERFRPDVVLIEDKASGTQLIQELIADGLHAVTRYRPQSDKVMRMHAQTAIIENGFVHLPDRALWLAPYVAELTTFPNGKHDDQVDSTAQMLDWFKSAAREPGGFYGYYRALAEELHNPETVRPAPLSARAGFRRS